MTSSRESGGESNGRDALPRSVRGALQGRWSRFRAYLRSADHAPAATAARREAAAIRYNLESLHEQPFLTADEVPVCGWACAEAGIAAVEVYLDDTLRERLDVGLPRPDVAEAHPEIAGAERSGFAGALDLSGESPGDHTLVVVIRDPAGQSVRVERTLRPIGPYHRYFLGSLPTAEEEQQLLERSAAEEQPVSFEIWLEVDGPAAAGLSATVDSIAAQAYPHWRVHLLARDGAAVEWPPNDERIAPGSAAELQHGEVAGEPVFLAFLRAGEILAPGALTRAALYLSTYPQTDLLYSDHDRVDPNGMHCSPSFKPDWSPDHLLSRNYVGGVFFLHASATTREIGQRLMESGGAGWRYDLLLQLADSAPAAGHLPEVLWSEPRGEPVASEREATAVRAALQRRGWPAEVEETEIPGIRRLRWQAAPSPKVSIIIPTTGDPRLLRPCVESLLERTRYPDYELLFLDNGRGSHPEGSAYLRDRGLRVLERDERFNWARLNNAGAAAATGELLLFLNDDIEVTDPGWLDELVSLALRGEVGCVGALLVYPDDRIQHGGVFLVDHSGGAWNLLRGEPRSGPIYEELHRVTREVASNTGACLMIRRELFEQLGGFDDFFAVVGNDTDLCLRAWKAGYRNLWTPHCRLVHHESVSRGDAVFHDDDARMWTRWGELLRRGDPYYNVNLSTRGSACALKLEAPPDPPRVRHYHAPLSDRGPTAGRNSLPDESSERDPKSSLAAPVVDGYWDDPPEAQVREGAIGVSGWLFAPDHRITEVTAVIDGAPPVKIRHGFSRPDVAAELGLAQAVASGFRATVRLPSHDERTVTIWATLENGERILCFERRFQRGAAAATQQPGSGHRATTAPEEELPPLAPASDAARRVLTRLDSAVLDQLLASGAVLGFPSVEQPVVTVLIVLFNRAELALRCLRSLTESTVPLEVVIVDNASTDATPRLLERLSGATILRNAENVGFLAACNQGAQQARGELLLLLNSDAELLPGSLEAAVETLRSADDIGAVTGKLIHPDGRLQEAGSIIWQDGACQGYGRGDDPLAPQYMFRREVDFGSGAFLLTRRDAFLAAGGFDSRYTPAYYEDAGYCVQLWCSGKRVVYEPRSAVLHFEFASSSSEHAIDMQLERREIFVRKHEEWLRVHTLPSSAPPLLGRSHGKSNRRLLLLDDRVPHAKLGSGYPRTLALLRAARELEYEITFYPLNVPEEPWEEAYAEVAREVELMLGLGEARLDEFLQERFRFYDAVIVSRPHNMRVVQPLLPAREEERKPAILYDAEAVFALRDVGWSRLHGETLPPEAVEQITREEISLAEGCDLVLTVSSSERDHFVRAGQPQVAILSHAIAARPTSRPFATRQGFLFVGAIGRDSTPNADSVCWLVEEILPRVRAALDGGARLLVAGRSVSERVAALADPDLELLGLVDDLVPLYDRARVFVAPGRFGAGIPLKVIEAAAHGVPVVGTSLLAEQLGWRAGVEMLVADDAESFAERCAELYRDEDLWRRLREGALARVEREHSPEAFRSTLAQALESAGAAAHAPS